MPDDHSDYDELKEELLKLKCKFETLKQEMSLIEKKLNDKAPKLKKTSSDALFNQTESFKKELQEGETVTSVKNYTTDEVSQILATQKKDKGRWGGFEANFGQYWLNKIGVIVFTLGIGFLINYTFKYFTPGLKILFGYVLGGLFFGLGTMYEKKDKFRNFGLALLAGGWAITYFVTYAMYHFDASRIIYSQFLDICLLSGVAFGMIAHALKYKSEGMVALALAVAFITSTLGGITNFTLFSSVILSVIVVFLTWKMQWIKMLVLGSVLTYGIHFVSISKSIGTEHLSVLFLTIYWVLYFVGIQVSRTDGKRDWLNQLTGANCANFLLFYLSCNVSGGFMNVSDFAFLFTLGVLYMGIGLLQQFGQKQNIFSLSNVVIGIMAMSLSLVMELKYSLSFVWLVEIPFLLLFGYMFKQSVYRFLAYALTVIGLLRECTFNYYGFGGFSFLGWSLDINDLLLIWSFISFSACTVIGAKYQSPNGRSTLDRVWGHIYCMLAGGVATFYISDHVSRSWLGAVWALEAIVLYGLACLTQWKRFLVYSSILLVLSFGYLIGIDIAGVDLMWIKTVLIVLPFFGIYFHSRLLPNKVNTGIDTRFVYVIGLAACAVAVFKYFDPAWMSLGFGVLGVFFILLGMLLKDSTSRLGGLFALLLTLVRIIFIDLAQLDIIVKIISFMILGGLFLVISYFYSKYQVGQEKENGSQNDT